MIAAPGASTIHAVAKGAPELALIAAVIHKALSDAKSGDTEALEWIESDGCRWFLDRLATDQVAAEILQERLIEQAGCMDGNLAPGNGQEWSIE